MNTFINSPPVRSAMCTPNIKIESLCYESATFANIEVDRYEHGGAKFAA
jgi:hypothetical protein